MRRAWASCRGASSRCPTGYGALRCSGTGCACECRPGRCSTGWARTPGCTSCTPSHRSRATAPTSWPPATTAGRWWPPPGRGRCAAVQFHPEKSGRGRAPPARQLRGRRGVMDLYAAIDVRDGRCVRLTQGDFDRQTTYDGDPVEVGSRVRRGGCSLGARRGPRRRPHRPARQPRRSCAAVAAAVAVPVQAGGGVRSADVGPGSVRRRRGPGRRRHRRRGAARPRRGPGRGRAPGGGGPRRPGRPGGGAGLGAAQAASGWPRCSTVSPGAVPRPQWSPASTRDGTLAGPDLPGLTAALGGSALPIVASGGVGSLDDLRALRRAGGVRPRPGRRHGRQGPARRPLRRDPCGRRPVGSGGRMSGVKSGEHG